MTYGFKMAADITDVRATGMMKEVEDDINRIIKVELLYIVTVKRLITFLYFEF